MPTQTDLNREEQQQLVLRIRETLGELAAEAQRVARGAETETHLNALMGLPAALRTELVSSLDTLDRLVRRYATLDQIEHHRRERGE